MASFKEESKSVALLLDLLEIAAIRLSDPKIEFGEETGVDVFCNIDGRTIGVQVTEYVADYGLPKPPNNSPRGEEKKLAQSHPRGYGFGGSAEYTRALAKTLKSKLQKTFSKVDEGWLLVAAQNPQYGSTSSTFVSANSIDVVRMNDEIHSLLADKHYAKAFLLLASERVVFEWNLTDRWHLRADKRVTIDPANVEALRKKLSLGKR